ncbi:MAG: hypothetical protein Q9186_004465 [Xanthomendoza sp. 1 TL-2023]
MPHRQRALNAELGNGLGKDDDVFVRSILEALDSEELTSGNGETLYVNSKDMTTQTEKLVDPTNPSVRSKSSPKRKSKIVLSRSGFVYERATPSGTSPIYLLWLYGIMGLKTKQDGVRHTRSVADRRGDITDTTPSEDIGARLVSVSRRLACVECHWLLLGIKSCDGRNQLGGELVSNIEKGTNVLMAMAVGDSKSSGRSRWLS